MIQDILPLHLQNQYEKRQPDDTSYMMIYRENKILVGMGRRLPFLRSGNLGRSVRQREKWCRRASICFPLVRRRIF